LFRAAVVPKIAGIDRGSHSGMRLLPFRYELVGRVSTTPHRGWITPIAVSLTLVAVTTVLLWQIDIRLNLDHLIFIYFVPTALVAIRYGSMAAMGATIASTLAAAYFLYDPIYSFFISSPLDVMELALFCLLALLASQVVSGFASDREVVRRRLS
jgi:K+-sensing histidine kinase KdpD